MKMRIASVSLAAATALTLCPWGCAEGQVYYVNPEGGSYYHTQRECVTVREEYRAGMVEVREEQLSQAYVHLKPCNICLQEKTQVDIPRGTMSFHYQSPYDTAENGALYAAGLYPAGSIPPGIYTADALDGCSGELHILGGDGQPQTVYALTGETSLSFYLGDGMGVEISEGCTVRKLAYAARLQTVDEQLTIPHARYMAMTEIPGRQYAVKAIEGTEGDCVVTDITGEVLQRLKLSGEEIAELDLENLYDVFVEFVNCVVWATEAGEG